MTWKSTRASCPPRKWLSWKQSRRRPVSRPRQRLPSLLELRSPPPPLRKFRQDAENRELLTVAKKYELLGKKPEELVPVLKSLKAAGGTAYNDMIGVLDANLEAVQKSGAFSELGKRGGTHGEVMGGAGDAWSQIEKKAEEIRKSAPAMSYYEAIDTACQQNPDLVHDYENGR